MSFYYISYLSFKKNGDVTVRVADSSLHPLTYHTVKAVNLKEEGKEIREWLKTFAVSVKDGNYHVSGRSCKILAKVEDALHYLRKMAPYNFTGILKDDDLGAFVADYVENEDYALDKFKKDIEKFLSVEYIKESLVEDSYRWGYIPNEYKELKSLAKYYLENCADSICFKYPGCLLLDRKSALKAVSIKGVHFRQINLIWGNDEEIVLAAFSEPTRAEHLPDLIGDKLLQNKDFIKKIIIAEPKLHWERFPKEIKEDAEVKAWLAEYNVWYQGGIKRGKIA